MQQRAFPGTALTHHGGERTPGNLQRHAGERRDLIVTLLVDLANVGAANHAVG
jgi:hypothetical protein